MTGTKRGNRWSAWAAALLDRRRRLAARTAVLGAVLAKPRAAGRVPIERWLLPSRTLLPRIHLSIQPLLRLHRESSSLSLRQTVLASPAQTFASIHNAPSQSVPAAKPLALVLQRLREPGRGMATRSARRESGGTLERPALARHLAGKVRREEKPVPAAPARVVARPDAPPEPGGRETATPWGSAPAASRTARGPWRGTPDTGTAPFNQVPAPGVDVEVLTERVMQQIDRRLHSWRERTGAF